MVPIGQPLGILLCALVVGAVAALTSPVWVRLAVGFIKGLRHQVKDAGSVVDRELGPQEREQQ